jgi:hypothetical protein
MNGKIAVQMMQRLASAADLVNVVGKKNFERAEIFPQ